MSIRSRIMFLALIVFLFSNSHLGAMTIKLHGSGGIVTKGDNPKICPNSSNDVCATITGPWWELLENWWKSLSVIKPTELQNAEIQMVNFQDNSVQKNCRIRIENGSIMNLDSKNQKIEITGSVIILKN